MKKHSIYLFVLLCAVAVACVPARKYEELNAKYKQTDTDKNTAKQQAQQAEALNEELKTQKAELEKRLADMETDTLKTNMDHRSLLAKYEKLNSLNDELLKKYASLQKGSQEENMQLVGQLDNARTNIQEKEDLLNQKEKDLEKLSGELKVREEKVVELQNLITKKDEAVKQLKDKIADALLSFKDKGLTVSQKNGKVYVSLESKLLFPSGSTEVDKNGKEALVKLAKVLEENKDIEIMVEGHTDTDKITATSIPRNNWELSVLRATAVVEIMLKNSKIDPKKLVPSGRSEFLPLAPDKAKNRRTEIILTPNLDKIMDIINK